MKLDEFEGRNERFQAAITHARNARYAAQKAQVLLSEERDLFDAYIDTVLVEENLQPGDRLALTEEFWTLFVETYPRPGLAYIALWQDAPYVYLGSGHEGDVMHVYRAKMAYSVPMPLLVVLRMKAAYVPDAAHE